MSSRFEHNSNRIDTDLDAWIDRLPLEPEKPGTKKRNEYKNNDSDCYKKYN